jgi:hypothetical protein
LPTRRNFCGAFSISTKIFFLLAQFCWRGFLTDARDVGTDEGRTAKWLRARRATSAANAGARTRGKLRRDAGASK